MAETMKTGAEAYGLSLMTGLGGKTPEEARVLIEDVVEACLRPKMHAYYLE